MSVANIEEIYDVDVPTNEPNGTSVSQCCDRHVLVNSRIPVNLSDGLSYIDLLGIVRVYYIIFNHIVKLI